VIRQDYEYRGLLATTWDLLRGDTSTWEDRFFCKEVIGRFGQPVLDVGCGTGRLLLDYLGEGIDIDGVDNSPEMLELCREKARRLDLAPSLYLQEMVLLDVPRMYRTILVPSSSFQLLTDSADARQAIARFFHHLDPGGALVMPFMILWKPGDSIQTDWEQRAERVRPDDGAIVRRQTRVRYDVPNQLEHTEDIFEVVSDGRILEREHHRRSPATRWYTQDQVDALYQVAGFRDIKIYSYFTFEPAPADAPIFTAIGVKPQ